MDLDAALIGKHGDSKQAMLWIREDVAEGERKNKPLVTQKIFCCINIMHKLRKMLSPKLS
ncbi:hypothetical protein T08_12897 [Trichinella sp. T8]|nr:hypothetical protein T08_12897 [Trichinella sp. T8]